MIDARYARVDRASLGALAKEHTYPEEQTDVIQHQRRPMEHSLRIRDEGEQMVRAEQEKKHHAAAHDRDGETGVVQAERKENNNRGAHVPERDFTLPAGVPAPHRPLGAEKLKRGLYDER